MPADVKAPTRPNLIIFSSAALLQQPVMYAVGHGRSQQVRSHIACYHSSVALTILASKGDAHCKPCIAADTG